MNDIEQFLRENAPETPAEGQFLIEMNARLGAVEGIKKTVDGERRRGRLALVIALAAGLVLGCLVTLLVLFCPVRVDGTVLARIIEALQSWKEVLVGVIASCAIALGVVFVTRKKEAL